MIKTDISVEVFIVSGMSFTMLQIFLFNVCVINWGTLNTSYKIILFNLSDQQGFLGVNQSSLILCLQVIFKCILLSEN